MLRLNSRLFLPPIKSKPHKSGFALVIALSLMAFVLLLLLSITTLVQVETRSAENTKKQTQARMNALLGLQQALGELQQAAGHDQRVTATGDLWTSPAVGTEHLVGVWSSEDGDGDGEPDGDFVRWLVSHDDESAASADEKSDSVNFVTLARPVETDGSGGYNVTNPDFVALVGEGSVAQNDPGQSPQAVVAQKLPIQSDSGRDSGNFAWWVGDNGVKATITQADPYAAGLRTGSDFPVNANMLSMQGSNVSALSDFATLDFSDKATVEKLQRSASLSDIELVDSAITSTVLKEHFHDLTTTSLGLQTNTRHGGLKRDLSLLFEMSDADFDDPAGDFLTEMAAVTDQESGGADVGGDGLVYDAPSAAWALKEKYALIFKEPVGGAANGDGVIYGPTWDMLRSYYRLYKGVDDKDSSPTLEEGWAQTYQPSKASIIANGGLSKAGGKENKMARYSLVAQGIRHDGPSQSPEVVKSTSLLNPNRWVSGVGSDSAFHPIRATRGSYLPYLTRMTMAYGITSVASGSGAYNLDIIWQPMLTFHNPYNVSIDMPRMRYATGMEFMKLHIKHTSGIVPDVDGVDGPDWKLNEEYEAGDAAKVFNYLGEGSSNRVMIDKGKELLFDIPATTFKPGEVKVFSVSGLVTDAGDPFYVTMTTNPPGLDTDGVHFNLPLASASTWRSNSAPDLEGLVYNIPANNVIEVRLQIKKETKFSFDVWNEEQQAFDNLIYYRQSSTAAPLYGNTKWDGQSQDNYEAAVQNFESSVIPNLVMDFYIKPLSFSEKLDDLNMAIVEVQNDRKVYPNFIATNPMAASFHDYGNGSIERQTFSSLYHCYAERYTSPSANHPRDQVMNLGDGSSSWGYNHGSLGSTRSILLDIPTAPMQSIGQFQHATTHSSPYFPVMAVGHSFSSPFVPYTPPSSANVYQSANYAKGWANGRAYTFERSYPGGGNQKPNEYAFYDLPYLLNEALWDGYYFSSIAPDQSLVDQVYHDAGDVESNHSANAASLSSVVDGFVAGDHELANARMRLLDAAPLGGSVADDLKDFRHSANHLAVSGAFNVNSTSVRAWTVLLSGYRDSLLKANDSGSLSDVDLAANESGFPGMSLAPGDAKSSGTSIINDAAWAGFMKLSDPEVEDLAQNIVDEIKVRAAYRSNNGSAPPVLSLGGFVNRMIINDTDYSRSGILQKAIEDSGLNDGLTGLPVSMFETANFNQNHNPQPYDNGLSRDYYPENDYSIDVRNVSPLALTQADILQAIGPVISARSDTFTIRSYGDVEDPVSGAVVSQVWCEAVVQRTTQEMEPDSNARRFELVSFRWLEPGEI